MKIHYEVVLKYLPIHTSVNISIFLTILKMGHFFFHNKNGKKERDEI